MLFQWELFSEKEVKKGEFNLHSGSIGSKSSKNFRFKQIYSKADLQQAACRALGPGRFLARNQRNQSKHQANHGDSPGALSVNIVCKLWINWATLRPLLPN